MAVTDAVETETRLEMEDIIVVIVYFLLIIGVGLYVGASLFVSNIGSEHFIGLAGSGAAGGIGVGAWEFNAILLLQLLGFVFVPVYIASQCYTMPEYLHKRFGGQRVRVYFAILSLILYIFTKCAVDLYTGAVFIQQSLGWDLYLSIFILVIIVGILTITGGLTAVIYTDTLQAFLMVAGAITVTVMGFNKVGGFEGLWRKYPYAMTNYTVPNTTCHYTNRNWYYMLRDPSDPEMPWPGFLFGQTPGSIWYWCSDQVIVQRALAAKSLSHAQGATILAGFIKILPLFFMVLPGMMARVLFPDEVACVSAEQCQRICQSSAGCTNIAFPKLVLSIMGKGLRGFMMAVMIAALMSDLDSIFNSASTLFTIDIWKRFRRKASVKELMIVGRVFIVVMIGVAIAWVPVVKEMQGGQIYLYIQEVVNYLAPPIAAVYLIGVLWPRCNEKGCFWGLCVAFVVGVARLVLIYIYPGPSQCGEADTRPAFLKDFHYMYYAILLFWITTVVAVIVSLLTEPPTYRKLYRTTFWTRYDKHDQEDVDSGKIQAMWHGPFKFTVADPKDSIAFDNVAMETDPTDVEMKVTNNTVRIEQKDKAELSKGVDNSHENSHAKGETSIASTPEKPKRSCKEFMYSWFCGMAINGELSSAEEEKAKKREQAICSLAQDRKCKMFLNVMMIFILLLGVFLYCFWSLWKYNPEGDVWDRLERGLWNITDYRYEI